MSVFAPRPLPPRLRLRAYTKGDFAGCMRIFETNRGHTLPDNPVVMSDYLKGPLHHHLIIESPGGVVASGGIESYAETNRSGLCFGMVDRDHHGKGLGTLLLMARLALVNCEEGEEMITMETSHLTEGFYRRFGFEPISEYENRYGFGLNHLTLGFWLYPETQREILGSLRTYAKTLEIVHDHLATDIGRGVAS